MTERIGRREAIKAIMATGASGLGMLLAPGLLGACSPLEKPIEPSQTPVPSETKIPTSTPASTPEPTITPEPTRGWETPSLSERINLLSNPDFFVKPIDGRAIISPQFDDAQWERLKDKTYFLSCDYKGNGCSEAVIASVIKMMEYFKTGKIPDVTAADIVNKLLDETYQGYQYIRPNNISMQDDPLKWALAFYGQETGLFKTVEGITPDWGISNTHVIPASEWNSIFKKGQKEVLDKGGVLVARVLKYGVPPGSAGHFIIISNFEGDQPLIVDSVGPKKDGERRGAARVVALGAYSEKVMQGVPDWGGKSGFLWMSGVIPTF